MMDPSFIGCMLMSFRLSGVYGHQLQVYFSPHPLPCLTQLAPPTVRSRIPSLHILIRGVKTQDPPAALRSLDWGVEVG